MTTRDFQKDEQLAGKELDWSKFIFSGKPSFELRHLVVLDEVKSASSS